MELWEEFDRVEFRGSNGRHFLRIAHRFNIAICRGKMVPGRVFSVVTSSEEDRLRPVAGKIL